MTDSDKTLRERLDMLDQMQIKALAASSEDNLASIGDGTPLGAGTVGTDTLSLSADHFETILIEYNDTEYVVVERGDEIALERCDDDE